MVQRVIQAGKKVKTPTGIHAMDVASALKRAEQGMQFIAVASELKLMTDAAQAALKQLHPEKAAQDVARY
jgi:2-keto-3-deoxy-L-rhamnonate aldolase RhmA